MRMRAGYMGLTCASSGLHLEQSPAVWKITRPWARWGLTVGWVWGPWRFPFRWDGDQWHGRPLFTLRLPFVVLPWVHVWYWPDRLLACGRAAWMSLPLYMREKYQEEHHPARLYAGGKVFFVRPAGEFDPNGHAWAGPGERGRYYVTASASFRRGGLGR